MVTHCMQEASKSELALSPAKRAVFEALRQTITGGAGSAQRIPRRPDLQVAPLSFAQQRLWFLSQLEPDSAAYNLPTSVRLMGPLEVVTLASSLAEVIRRHESLRTTFSNVNGTVVQVIAPAMRADLAVVDLTGLPAANREEGARQHLNHEVLKPFDLRYGPLVRCVLLRLGEQDYVLVVNMHHIVTDGWSMGIFWRELMLLYDAFSSGKPSPLAELPIQYADYAIWQRRWLQGEEIERRISYWNKQLAGAPSLLDLPLDATRPPRQTYQGGSEALVLAGDLSDAIQALARQENVSLFMLLTGTFQLLLQRLSGQDDVVIGVPVAGRNRVETEGLIGFFINTVVLRTDLSGNPTFRDLLRRVREVVLGAHAHQDLPFEKVVEELHPQRTLSYSPLFQVMLNLLNLSPMLVQGRTLRAEPFAPSEGESKFDLTLYASEHPGKLGFRLVYNADLFRAERMQELLRQLEHLLRQIAADPAARIGDYCLVPNETRPRLPDATSALKCEWAGSVHEHFSRQAQQTPGGLAILDQGEAWTYAELEARSNQVAHFLRSAGVGARQRVAVYAARRASLVVAMLGVLKAGAAFVILDPAHPPRRLVEYLELARPQAWLQSERTGRLPALIEEAVAACGCAAKLVLPDGKQATGWEQLRGISIDTPAIAVGPDDLAYVAFTSGTTGTPKGVQGTHRPVAHFVQWHCRTFGFLETDRFSLLSGLAHDPLLRDVFTPLWAGATLCIPNADDILAAGRLAKWMRDAGVTVTHLTPAMAQLLALPPEKGQEPHRLGSLRYAFFGGDRLTAQDVRCLRAVAPTAACVNFYGTMETPQAMGWYVVPDGEWSGDSGGSVDVKSILPVGRGIDGVQLLVLNPANQLAGVGERGRIFVRTPYLTLGYEGDEALTRERYLTNPSTRTPGDRIYATGDLGRYRPDGTVEFLGRSDFQVKLRGYRVELGEIEGVLAQHPDVRQAVVSLREDTPGEKRLAAYLVPRGSPASATDEVRDFVRQRLPDYMVPTAFVWLPALPLTPNGKVDHRALPVPVVTTVAGGARFVAPRTAVEEVVASIWTELLRVAQVGVEADFFELGGHSLLATQILSRVNQTFQAEVPLRRLFEAPTVAGLAQAIVAAEATPGQAERIAQIVRRIARMSPEERQRTLQQKQTKNQRFQSP